MSYFLNLLISKCLIDMKETPLEREFHKLMPKNYFWPLLSSASFYQSSSHIFDSAGSTSPDVPEVNDIISHEMWFNDIVSHEMQPCYASSPDGGPHHTTRQQNLMEQTKSTSGGANTEYIRRSRSCLWG